MLSALPSALPTGLPALEAGLAALALLAAAFTRPWRLLAQACTADPASDPATGARRWTPTPLLTPTLATLVVLPWLWALPALHTMPLQLQWSGAGLVLLMLGWPLAVPVLLLTGALAVLISPMEAAQGLRLAVWLGVVPATLALGLGAAIRRWVGTHPFVYVLGRAFLGTVLCLFAASALSQWAGFQLPGVSTELSMVARWLMAWGDAFVTGMLTAIFVAFKPQWLATWSDGLYLRH